jgi:hypothetical protein
MSGSSWNFGDPDILAAEKSYADRYGNERLERDRAKVSAQVDEVLKRVDEEKLDPFIQTRYTRAALAGLARHGEPADVELARTFLDSDDSDSVLEAIRIVGRFGSEDDAAALIQLAVNERGERAREAAAAALKLSPSVDGALSALIQDGRPEVARFALEQWASDHRDAREELLPVLRSLLHNSAAAVREAPVRVLTRLCTTDELEEVLSEYTEGGRYYYNVVGLLDRELYAPPSLKQGPA